MAWLMTAIGSLMVAVGAFGVALGNVLAWQGVLTGLLVAVLAWAIPYARGTMRPGWATIAGAAARRAARRLRYLAAFLALLAAAWVLLAVAVAGDPGLAAMPPPGGRGLAAVLTLGLAVVYLGLAVGLWLRARLIDSWA